MPAPTSEPNAKRTPCSKWRFIGYRPLPRNALLDGQWAMQGKNYSAQRYSTLSQITADNVKNLKTAWTFSLGTLQGQEGGPLVVGTSMYVHSSYPNNVYALDLTKPGAPVRWKYTPKQDDRAVRVDLADLARGYNRPSPSSRWHQKLSAADASTLPWNMEKNTALVP